MDRLASASLALIACAITAAAPVPATGPPPAEPSGRIAYPPAFFAAARPDTAYDMILLLPAFAFDPGQDARGYEASAGNVLIDGQWPSTKFDALADILKRIPAASVACIELIRGGAPGIDMLGHTVVANVVRLGAVTSLTSQSDLLLTRDGRIGVTTRLDATRRQGASSLEGSINLFDHQGPSAGRGSKVRRTADGAPVSSTDLRIANPNRGIKASVQLERPQWGGLLRLKASTTIGTNASTETDRVIDATGSHGDVIRGDFSTRQGELSADFKRRLDPRLELSLVALQNFEKSRNVANAVQGGIATDAREDDLTGESIVRAELSWQASTALSAQFGAEGAYNFLNGTSALAIGGVPEPLPSADVRVAERRAELSAQASWKPSPKWLIEVGSHFELSRLTVSGDARNSVSFTFPKPRLFAAWSPTEEDQLRLRIERVVSQLDFGQFVSSSSVEQGVVTAGNEKLVPQRDWVFEAAWERHLAGDGALVLTLTHFLLQQVIDEVPVAGFSAPGNIGNGTRDQAELNLTLPLDRFGLKRARLKFDGTWRRSRVTDPTTGERRRITNDQPFSGTLSLTQEIPGLRSVWRIDATGPYRYDVFRIDELQHFRVGTSINVSWEYKARPDLSFLIQVQNLPSARTERERLIFSGLRRGGSLAFVDLRDVSMGPRLYFLLRKTF